MAAGCDADALGRVLRYLAARGVFVAAGPDRFELGETARWLLDDDPSAARRWLDQDGYGATMDRAHLDLLGIVRRGGPVQAANKTSLDPAAAASYDQLMEANTTQRGRPAGPGDRLEPVRDTSSTSAGAPASSWSGSSPLTPSARGTLVDLPSSAEKAEQRFAEAGLGGRCGVLAGNLFELELPEADAFLLRMLLHSFEDDLAADALTKCRRALRPGGSVFVAETADTHPAGFTTMDVLMLVLGHGRERTLAQYDELAAAAGLTRTAIHTPPYGPRAIEYSV